MGSSDVDKHESEQFRKLFIGGLDYRTKDESLKEFFEKWGEIVDVVVMKDTITKRSRGFGFITYLSSSMVDEAMANRPHTIDGRVVETKRAVPRDDIGKPDRGVTVKKMFVGGLKENIGENELRQYFGEYGNILNVNIPVNKDTGIPRGFAFIEFDDYDSVDKIILKRRHTINGKPVDVKKALSKEDANSNKGNQGGGGRGGGRGDSGSWNNRNVMPSQNNWGNDYGGGPWETHSGGQGWGNQQLPAQNWGASTQSSGYGSGQSWNDQQGYQHQQQGYSGGPMRSNTYSGGNRNAPYGAGAASGGGGGGGNYGGGSMGGGYGGGGRRY